MRQFTAFILLVTLASQASSAPQFVSFKDGKLGVNFGGYHAAVGIGGLLGQSGGAGGGLFAEAGTPHGQAAKAGLGGALDGSGMSAGNLYAGATAGGNVRAAAGLAGGMTPEKSAGTGFAAAQAGNQYAMSGLGGVASDAGSSGFTFSGAKSYGISKGNVDSVAVKPLQVEHKKVHKEFNVDATNELNFVPLAPNSDIGVQKEIVKANVQPQVIVKEVSRVYRPIMYYDRIYSNKNLMNFLFRVPPMDYKEIMWWGPHSSSSYNLPQVYVESPPQVVEKHIVHKHNKPRHHLHKTAYIGGYIGGADNVANVQAQPAIQKRIDVDVAAVGNTGATAEAGANGNTAQTYTKQVTFQRNPNFFADIFNIPISTLKAVGNFLGNTAGSTNVSVQKSGSVQAETDSISPKHAATSSVSSSEAHVSVQSPNVSKVIDDIFAIPINTLGAVNKFLENNVPARKSFQIAEDGSEPARVRFGPHARRRANKQVIIVQQENVQKSESEQSS